MDLTVNDPNKAELDRYHNEMSLRLTFCVLTPIFSINEADSGLFDIFC